MTQATLAYTYAHIRRNNPRLPACKALERARKAMDDGKGKTYAPSPRGGVGKAFDYAGERVRWIESTDAIGLRHAGFADEIYRYIKHTGWFTGSTFQDETLRGSVYRLPGKGKRARYIYGYDDPCNKGAALLTCKPEIGDLLESSWDEDSTLIDCAKWADGMAESAAESQREYNDAWQAANQWQELCYAMASTRQEARELVKALRAAIREGLKGAPAICLALRNQLRALLATWEEQRQERDNLADDFHYWEDGKSMDIAEFAGANL